jgi:hypothetical protein
VKVGIALAEPYEPAVTVVLSRFSVMVFVDDAIDESPVPPDMVTVSASSTVCEDPESPAKVKLYVAATTALSTYAVVANDVELFPAVCVVAVAEPPRANVPENVLFPVIV